MSNMATKYNMMKRRKKMAEGGSVAYDKNGMPEDANYDTVDSKGNVITKAEDRSSLSDTLGSLHDAASSLVDRIMKKRSSNDPERYSEGGEVANEGEDKLHDMADSDPNEFDELAKDDTLSFSDTDKNSGDEDGDKQEDEDRHDIVSRIMKSRALKDKLPKIR